MFQIVPLFWDTLYTEATTSSHKKKWKKALEEGNKSLQKNNTWKVGDRATVKGRKLLTSKWVFKEQENGKRKVRLVIRGCQ